MLVASPSLEHWAGCVLLARRSSRVPPAMTGSTESRVTPTVDTLPVNVSHDPISGPRIAAAGSKLLVGGRNRHVDRIRIKGSIKRSQQGNDFCIGITQPTKFKVVAIHIEQPHPFGRYAGQSQCAKFTASAAKES